MMEVVFCVGTAPEGKTIWVLAGFFFMVFLSCEGNQMSFFYCRASDILFLQRNPGGFFFL